MKRKVTALAVAVIMVLQLIPMVASADVISTTMDFSEFNLAPDESIPISQLFDGTNWTAVGTNFVPDAWYATTGVNYSGPAKIVTDDGYNALMYSDDTSVASDRIFREMTNTGARDADLGVPNTRKNTLTYTSFKLKVDPSSTPVSGDYIRFWYSDDFNAASYGSDAGAGLYYTGSAYQLEVSMNSGDPPNSGNIPFSKGEYYNVLICLNGVVSGNDIVSMKVWPLGAPEPTAWQHSVGGGKAGYYTRMMFESRGFKRTMFADFKQEVYNDITTAHMTPLKNAETVFAASDTTIKSGTATPADKQTALDNAESAYTAASAVASPIALQTLRNRLIQFRNAVGDTPIPVTDVSMTTSAYVTETADEVMLDATVLPLDASNQTIIYSSDNENVATVDAKGLVRFEGAGGTATITATSEDGSFSKTRTFTLNKIAVESVSVQSTLSIQTFETIQLTETFTPETASVKTVTWESDNTEVATVDAFGYVTGIIPGTAKITVKSTDDPTKFAECAVTVNYVLPTSIALNKTEIGLALNTSKNQTLTATVGTPNTTNKNVIWSSDDPEIATVNAAGYVLAQAVGTTTIRATCEADNTVNTACTVTVIPVHFTSITFEEGTAQRSTSRIARGEAPITQGDSLTLTITTTPPEAINYITNVEWPTSGNSFVSVPSADGLSAKFTFGMPFSNWTVTTKVTNAIGTSNINAYIDNEAGLIPTFVFKKSSSASTILSDGTWRSEYKITNTTGFSVLTPVFAIYNNGVLEKVISGTPITDLAQGATTATLTTQLGEITDSANKSIKLFLWENFTSLKPMFTTFKFDSTGFYVLP